MSTIIAALTGLCCWVGWATHAGAPLALPLHTVGVEEDAAPEYLEQPGEGTPLFFPDDSGVPTATCPEGWYFSDVTFLSDLDGDGWSDLGISSGRSSTCGNDVEGRLQIVSGRDLMILGAYHEDRDFRLERSAGDDLLLRYEDGWGGTGLELFDDFPSRVRWQSRAGDGTGFVGDLDGDGFADVAQVDPWDDRSVDGETVWVGSVHVRSGRDGAELWKTFGDLPGVALGYDVCSAGDHDGDGVPEVAVLGHRFLTLFSGTDGALLEKLEFSSQWNRWWMEPAGDLDGDGLAELAVHEGGGRDPNGWVVYSSASLEVLDPTDGWQLMWSTASGDLDGDGADDLVLGRRDPETGEKRLSTYSTRGLRDLGPLDEGLPGGLESHAAYVGRLEPGGPWVLVVLASDGKAGWMGGRSNSRIVELF